MNFFICKCDKNQAQEEKTAMDLLDIKNLEKSLRNNEKEILITDNILEAKNNTSSDELEIIDYPYTKEEDFNNNKNFNPKNIKKSQIQLVNKPKISEFNKSKNLFNNKKNKNPKYNKKFYTEDLNSSLYKNESLIIDDIEYLNDDDEIQDIKELQKSNDLNNSSNNKTKKMFSKADINKLLNEQSIKNYNHKNFYKNNSNKGLSNRKINNESLKSWTTKVSSLNNSNKKNKKTKKLNLNKIYSLSQKNDDKKFSKNLSNYYKTFKTEKTFKINRNKILSLNKTNENNNNNKQDFNNLYIYKSNIKNEKDNKKCHNFSYKRIKKRKVNFIKKDDLKNSKIEK